MKKENVRDAIGDMGGENIFKIYVSTLKKYQRFTV